MLIENYGNALIASELKKLKKKRRSIEKDLSSHFANFREQYLLYDMTSDDRIYFDENGVKGHEMKISIKSDSLSKQKGARLWYLLIPDGRKIIFLPCILFDCRNEDKYPKRTCSKIIGEKLKDYYNDSNK